MKNLNLFDFDQQKEVTFPVTDEDFKDITENENLALATTLFEKHQKQIRDKENFVAAFNLMQQSSLTTSSSQHLACMSSASQSSRASSPSNTFECENTKIWNDITIQFLINLCKKHDKDFSSGIKKYVWSKIAKELSEKFKQVYTPQQCDTKWKGLKNTYKIVKKHNEQSGNNYRFWKFYDSLDQVLFSKPEINAIATCSSAKGLVIRRPNTEQNNDNENADEACSHSNTNPPKNYTSSFIRKRKSTENAVERRHQEKMARQDKFLDLLGRLTNAIEGSIPQPP